MAKYKKSNEPITPQQRKEANEVREWLTRTEYSRRYKKKAAEHYHWLGLTEKYRGYFRGLQDSADIYIPTINYIFAYIKSEIPRLALRDPKIKVNPKKGSSILSAKILEKALNYIWRVKKLKRETKKNILDVLLVGHSWFKTGYTGKFGTIEDANGNTFEFIESEDFFGYRVPYDNILFNPDANDPPFDCDWIAHEVWMSLDELQKNKSFKHTKELEPSLSNEDNESTVQSNSLDNQRRFDPDRKMIKLYEVWDKKSQQIFTITDGCPFYIREPQQWPYDMKGFPFSYLRLNDDPMCPYGIPDCYMFEPQVLELIKIRAQELDHIKRFNRQLLYAEGHITEDGKNLFSQGITGAAIPVLTNGRPLSEIVAPVPYPTLQTDIYAIEDRIQADMVRIHGQNINEQGGIQKTATRSLGELEQISAGSSNRREDKLDTIEDFIEDIASNFVALLQQLADVNFYVAVVGEDAEQLLQNLKERPSAGNEGAVTTEDGFTFTKEDIQGEFDFEVVPGSTKPLDQQQTMAVLMQSLEMLPKLGVQPGPVTEYIGMEIAEGLGLEGFKLAVKKEIEATHKRLAQAQEEQQKMVELQVAQSAADTQIKAEREATKQSQLQFEVAKESGMFPGHKIEQDKLNKPNVKK